MKMKIFRFVLRVFQTIRPGRIARARSVRIVEPVEVYDSATIELMLAQEPAPVQFAEIGLQRSKTPIRVTSIVVMVSASSTKTLILYALFVLATIGLRQREVHRKTQRARKSRRTAIEGYTNGALDGGQPHDVDHHPQHQELLALD